MNKTLIAVLAFWIGVFAMFFSFVFGWVTVSNQTPIIETRTVICHYFSDNSMTVYFPSGTYYNGDSVFAAANECYNFSPSSTVSIPEPKVKTWNCINYGMHLWRNPTMFPENQDYIVTTTPTQTPQSLGYSNCTLQ